MASLALATTDDAFTFVASRSLAVLLATPLLASVAVEVYPYLSSMPAAQAVVFFGVVGGASGMVSQFVAAGQLGKLYRDVNAFELFPAVVASIVASAAVTYALVPPNPNPVTTYLAANNSLPN